MQVIMLFLKKYSYKINEKYKIKDIDKHINVDG
jgi:hypothetical protein